MTDADGAPGRANGTWVCLEPLDPTHHLELARLDWLRSLSPEMGGRFRRQEQSLTAATTLFRARSTGELLGVLEAAFLPGYPDVANVSIFTDTAVAAPGWAMDAYGLHVALLFERGARLVHHEVLELNRPIQRILRGIGVEPSARYREHAYAAGRLWDVIVYSYDRAHWEGVLARFGRRRVGRPLAPPVGPGADRNVLAEPS